MTDYFSEYQSFVGAKGLPSPADTPYETPGFIRSKRSSRATAGSSREQSASPPPLPPDTTEYQNNQREGRYSALDPRRFTPTLHASLVSEILTLRRDLDSKNNLVENLETSLSTSRIENEALAQQLSDRAKEIRRAKTQVVQIEKGTYDAVEDLARERDAVQHTADDLRNKLDVATRKARQQDEDAVRTQGIWESEKESWENERRQMERRIHVTENRLRTFVDEMTAQQAVTESQTAQTEAAADESTFKDSGLGNESDTGSIRSSVSPSKHKRSNSSISFKRKSMRNSASIRTTAGTPDLYARPLGNSLAEELGIDEEDEYDIDDLEHGEEELEYHEMNRRTMESRQSSVAGECDSKAKRVLGLMYEAPGSPTIKDPPKRSAEASTASVAPRVYVAEASAQDGVPRERSMPQEQAAHQGPPVPRVEYVDSGYQPSPPPSPMLKEDSAEAPQLPTIQEPFTAPPVAENEMPQAQAARQALEVATRVAASPISPPQTPTVDGAAWPEGRRMSIPTPVYSSATTQTDFVEPERPKSHRSNRDSLSPPAFVPSIAIHPPSSRPSSPRPCVLPPGTKNASCQTSLPQTSRDASVQTDGIRIDKRQRKLPTHLLPSYLLPSPIFAEEQVQPAPLAKSKRAATGGTAKIFVKVPPATSLPSPPVQSPDELISAPSRDISSKDHRNVPLRVIPLPRPVLSPSLSQKETFNDGPFNRSSQYGVTRPLQSSSQLANMDKDSDVSDDENPVSDVEPKDLTGSTPAISKAPQGRFGLSEPPKVVPEDEEMSPERRPDTAGSYGAAPAPSVASSRPNSQCGHIRHPPKLNAYKDLRSRSPSFGSVASSSYSTQSAIPPPFPIPTRSSSRVVQTSHSEGSGSPTRTKEPRASRAHHNRQNSLRKVQSAAAIRNKAVRTSPPKSRRRRRSPNLTPVQSMALESPAPTQFPIPEMPTLPTPLKESMPLEYVKGSIDLSKRPETASTLTPRTSDESNLVDAIAATMVGEWMWKYIRKKKSFGKGEDSNDFVHPGMNGAVSMTAHGTRHKRWVWLSPYERTIMWDNKQPTSGNALLGKKGRKLAIQAILDVQDDTTLPKGAELSSAFYRSILILTPARALKFTCITQERHLLWMTALAFLAESGRLPAQLPPMPTNPRPKPPAILPPEPAPIERSGSPSFGRAKIRDSVRLTQGRRPSMQKSNSRPAATAESAMMSEVLIRDGGAEFPAVPRLYVTTSRHQRKRSYTSPRLPTPLNNVRNFSSSAIPSSASSLRPATTKNSSFRTDLLSSSSKSGSRRDSITSPDRPNFFEAVGTVRMDAFVDPNIRDGVLYVPAPPPAAPPQPRRRRGDSALSTSTADKRRAGYVFDEDGHDPFKGF